MITAMVDLVEQHKIDPARVKKIRIGLSKFAFDLHGGFATYKAKFEAMLSAHYVAAVILHDRALSLPQFEPARYDDPRLRRFAAEQVEVRLDPALTGVQSTAQIELADGATMTARCDYPRGAAENPMSPAQIDDKFRAYAPARLSDSAVESVIGAVHRLEEFGSVQGLMDLLRETPPRAARRTSA